MFGTDAIYELTQAELAEGWVESDRQVLPDCDLDHRVAVADGGPTTSDNLAPLCRHHHRTKHQASWKSTLQPNGDHTWLSRLGHTYTTNGQSP
jgi:hypothetical protein